MAKPPAECPVLRGVGAARDAASGWRRFLPLALLVLAVLVLFLRRERLRGLWLRHRRSEEIKRCRGYIATHPDSEEACALQYKIARLFQESLRDHAQAIVEFKRFLERYPDNILAENSHYYLANCWEELGNLPLAQFEYGQLLRRYPGGVRENDAKIRIEEIVAKIGDPPVEVNGGDEARKSE